MKELIQQLPPFDDQRIQQITPVHGGDINEAYIVQTDDGRYFLKLNKAGQFPGMFETEGTALQVLRSHFQGKVPHPLESGIYENQQYLLMECLEPASHTAETWPAFGAALAKLHQVSHPSFGWQEANYIGAVRVTNDWSDQWPEFYAGQRILPLVKMLRDSNAFTEQDVQQAEIFCRQLKAKIPAEPPSLLHGDLWSGNQMAVKETSGGLTTAIFDPAAFYGHREMDVALTLLFGGFSPLFYAAYQQTYPLEKGWEQRIPLFQLCPLLVHAVLFGGSYTGRARQIIRS